MAKSLKTVLVTGANGFIGSALVTSLSTQYYVRAMVREHGLRGRKGHTTGDSLSRAAGLRTISNVTYFTGDVTDLASCIAATKGVDVVYHLAAKTSEKASEIAQSHAVNVGGTKNIISACLVNKVTHLIVVSSQSTKRARRGAYGETKRLADVEVMGIPAGKGLKYTIVKPTLVYGPGSKGLFSKVLKLVEKLPVIPIVGDGRYKMQPIHVDDVVGALRAITLNPATYGKTYDLAGGTRLSFNELISTIQRVLGSSKKVVHVPYSFFHAGVRGLSLITTSPPITKDNLLGLMQETSISLDEAKADFGFTSRSFASGMTQSIWGERDSSKVQVGIIGLGKMGLLHASLVNHIDSAQLCGVFDVNTKVRRQIASLNIRAPFYSNLALFLDEVKPDAVIISIPPAFTLPTIREVVKRDIAFLVEKPLADSLEHAQEIVQMAEAKKLVGAVGFMQGYTSRVHLIEALLRDRIVGKIRSFEGSAYVTQVLSRKKGWRYDKKTAGGGCVSLHGTHLLYLTYRLFGLPTRVRGKLEFPYSAVEDKAEIGCSYKDNVTGTLRVSWSEKGYSKLTIGLTIIGENGTMRIEDDRVVLDLKKGLGGYSSGVTVINREDFESSDFELGGDGYYQEDLSFIRAVRVKEGGLVTLQDGFNVQKFLNAVYQSHAQKKEVRV